MSLTLSEIAKDPSIITTDFVLSDGEKVTFRPLEPHDANALSAFLRGLSKETRRLSTFEGYDLEAAQKLCDAINKHDKLRLVVVNCEQKIIGLIELSLDLPESDIERFKSNGFKLNHETDCRLGPTLADDYQGKGLGSRLFPEVARIVSKLGKQRIILWGGVHKDNKRAIHFYEKQGFKRVGEFTKDGAENLDMVIDLKNYSGA